MDQETEKRNYYKEILIDIYFYRKQVVKEYKNLNVASIHAMTIDKVIVFKII